MGQLLFLIVVIVISVLSSSKKAKTDDSLTDSPGLDDIFKEVMAASKAANGGNQNNALSSGTKYQQPRKQSKKNKASLGSSLTTPSNHSGHKCDDVNYDQLDSLMGKSENFNLGEPEPYYEPLKKPDFSMTRDDLLKSFIMSEVLQRYDINRIHSRIPSAKTDD